MGLGYSNTTVDHQSSLPGDNPLIGEEIVRLMRPNTRVVYFESAGSPTFEVQDVPAIAAAAHEAGAKVLMDNTWASPYLFRSFDRLTYGKPGLKNDGFPRPGPPHLIGPAGEGGPYPQCAVRERGDGAGRVQ
jgi:hypothetical protein